MITGCNKSGDPVEPPTGGGGTAVDPEAPIVLEPVEHPSQLLPRDTSFLVTFSGFARLSEIIDRPRLVAEFRPQYAGLQAVITGSLGHNLSDPETWAEVGLDASKPMALSLSDVNSARFVVFATIADREKLVTFIQKLASDAKAELTEDRYGGASVWRMAGSNGAVVLRDDLVALVVEGRAQEGFDLPKVVATMDPNLSLAAQVDYRKSTGGMRAADMTVFVDLAQIVAQTNADAETRAATPQSNWAQERLEEAQKEGADPERLAELGKQAEEERQRQQWWRTREEGERELSELLVSGIEGVGLSATVKRSGPVFDGRVVASEEAFLRRLVDNRQGAPALTHSMNGTPIWCMSGRVVADAGFELLPLVAKAEGQEYEAFLGEMSGKIGLNLHTDLRPVMDGDSELCVSFDAPFDPSAKNPLDNVGLSALVTVKEEAQAKYLLAKIASSKSRLASQMRKRGEGYDAALPDWRTMHLDAVGNRVVVSTDRDLAKRLAAGDPGSMPSKIRPTGARGAINIGGTAASQAFDISLLALMFVGQSVSTMDQAISMNGRSAEEMAAIPHSSKSKKAKKALKKATDTLAALQRKESAADVQRVLEVTDPLGIMAVAATEDERGFTLTGGQFIRAETVSHVVEGLLRAAMTNGPRRDSTLAAEFDAAWEARMKAEQAYGEAREEDAARHDKKKGKKR